MVVFACSDNVCLCHMRTFGFRLASEHAYSNVLQSARQRAATLIEDYRRLSIVMIVVLT